MRRQLAELDGSGSRRRQITVLFADVSGFTALSETLDPEILAGLMNDLWDRLDADRHRVRWAGRQAHGRRRDGVVGRRGRPEDDVERAVRAGLALQEALAGFDEQTGHHLAMRVGINTGQALVGAVGSTAELTAMGDTVNVASRLEHAAPVGSVLVSHDTYRHVRGVFDVAALDPLEVRGKSERVQAYVVLRAKPRAFRIASRGVEGVETPDRRARRRAGPAPRGSTRRRLAGEVAVGARRR